MEKKIKELEKIIKYNFKKVSLLEKALTHKSYDNISNNEKLEFLGDRVLGLIISQNLLKFFPKDNSPSFVLGPSAIICPENTFSPGQTIGL